MWVADRSNTTVKRHRRAPVRGECVFADERRLNSTRNGGQEIRITRKKSSALPCGVSSRRHCRSQQSFPINLGRPLLARQDAGPDSSMDVDTQRSGTPWHASHTPAAADKTSSDQRSHANASGITHPPLRAIPSNPPGYLASPYCWPYQGAGLLQAHPLPDGEEEKVTKNEECRSSLRFSQMRGGHMTQPRRCEKMKKIMGWQ